MLFHLCAVGVSADNSSDGQNQIQQNIKTKEGENTQKIIDVHNCANSSECILDEWTNAMSTFGGHKCYQIASYS